MPLPAQESIENSALLLTDFQIQTLLKTIDKKSSQGFRDYSIFILLIQYGLRISEVANLCVDDINWEDKTIVIKDRKNDPHLLLPLTEQVARILKAYITLFRPPYVYPGGYYDGYPGYGYPGGTYGPGYSQNLSIPSWISNMILLYSPYDASDAYIPDLGSIFSLPYLPSSVRSGWSPWQFPSQTFYRYGGPFYGSYY